MLQKNNIRVSIISFLLGAIITGSAFYFITKNASDRRVEQLTNTNRILAEDEQRSRNIIKEQARIIGSAKSSIEKLREIIELIPENY